MKWLRGATPGIGAAHLITVQWHHGNAISLCGEEVTLAHTVEKRDARNLLPPLTRHRAGAVTCSMSLEVEGGISEYVTNVKMLCDLRQHLSRRMIAG